MSWISLARRQREVGLTVQSVNDEVALDVKRRPDDQDSDDDDKIPSSSSNCSLNIFSTGFIVLHIDIRNTSEISRPASQCNDDYLPGCRA